MLLHKTVLVSAANLQMPAAGAGAPERRRQRTNIVSSAAHRRISEMKINKLLMKRGHDSRKLYQYVFMNKSLSRRAASPRQT